MGRIKEYKQKVTADIALLEAELTRFKVRGIGFTTDAKQKHGQLIEALEAEIDGINNQLSTLAKTDEQRFERLRKNIDHRWKVLRVRLLNATETFQTEPGVADAHGGDDGPYPYGIGLSGSSTLQNRSSIMGDKGGKKSKIKSQKQSKEKQKQKQKQQLEKQPKVSPIPGLKD